MSTPELLCFSGERDNSQSMDRSRLQDLLIEIATEANIARELVRVVGTLFLPREVDAQVRAIGNSINKMGWLADSISDRVGSCGPVRGSSAENWFFDRQQEVTHENV